MTPPGKLLLYERHNRPWGQKAVTFAFNYPVWCPEPMWGKPVQIHRCNAINEDGADCNVIAESKTWTYTFNIYKADF